MEPMEHWHPQYFRLEAEDTPPETMRLLAFSMGFAAHSPLCVLRGMWQGQQPESLEITLPSGPWQALEAKSNVPLEGGRFQAALTRAAFARLSRLSERSPLYAGENLDGQAVVHLSHEDMVAWIFLLPPVGQGHELSSNDLLQALIEKGVTQGIDLEFLCRLPHMEGRYFTPFPVAMGRTPSPGRDGWVEELFPRTLTPFLSGNLEDANYVTLNLVRKVKEGETLCRLHPAVAGQPGRTVGGRTLAPPPTSSPSLEGGRGTRLSSDGLSLLAARNGHVQFSGKSFLVQPVLEISGDVTAEDGAVSFLGDVYIHGDMSAGSILRATGNVQIDGVVEGCRLEAGENLVISRGVQGQGEADIRAYKSIFAKYMERCNAYAGESIYADCIVDSNVYSDDCIYACTGRGVIVGGSIHAAQTVSAQTVGSKNERPTSIFLGGSPNEEFERAQLQAEENKALALLETLEGKPQTPEVKKQIHSQRLALKVVQMKLNRQAGAEHLHPEKEVAPAHRHLLCDACYPVTTVTIDREFFQVTKYTAPCAIGLDD